MYQSDDAHAVRFTCPACQSEEIEGGEIYVDDSFPVLYRDMACTECHSIWVDQFKLVGYCDLVDRTSMREVQDE